ncbi:MAG: efflux RND transporter permease subunit [Brevinema sp.]
MIMKKMIEFSINHQRFFNTLVLIIVGAAIYTYIITPKDLLPELKEGYINIEIVYPGASAELIQQEITHPVETKLTPLVEVERVSSISRQNYAAIEVKVNRNFTKDLSIAYDKIQNTINDIAFPEKVLTPKLSTFTLKDLPVLSIHLESSNQNKLYQVSKNIEQELLLIPTLKPPIIDGRQKYEYKIKINPYKLQTRGISLGEIYNSFAEKKSDIPGGEVKQDDHYYKVNVVSPLENITDVENIVIRANEQGNTVRLKDVAEVEFSFEEPKSYHSVNGHVGIIFHIIKKTEADIINIKKVIDKLVQKYQKQYPDIIFSVFGDQSLRIKNRINLLNSNLSIGLILVFIVLVLFFNFYTSLWTTLGVPVAFSLALITGVLFTGIDLNTISIIGFLLILGVVVDDGIVFSENAYRHFEMGKTPKQAVIDGMSEVSLSVIFATLTTIASVVTIFILDLKIGDLSRPLAIVMIFTLVSSTFEALFVLPGHLVHSFTHIKKDNISKIAEFKNKMFDFLKNNYSQILFVLVTHRKKSFFILIAIIFTLTALMAINVPFLFFAGPIKTISVFFETPVNSSLEENKKVTDQISHFFLENSAFDDVYAVSGFQGEKYKTAIRGDVNIAIHPNYNWLSFKNKLKNYIDNNISNISQYRFNPIGEDSFYFDKLDFAVKGTNLQAVQDLAEKIKIFLQTRPNIDNPRINISAPTLVQEIIVKEDKARSYGVTPKNIAQNISMAYEGVVAGSIVSGGDSHTIRLSYDSTYHTVDSLMNMRIPNNFNRFVQLNQIAEIRSNTYRTDIYSDSGFYIIRIQDSLYDTKNIANNASQLLNDVKKEFAAYSNTIDAFLSFDDEKQEVDEGVKKIIIALIVGVILVFLIILYMFNSFIATLLATFGIPFIFFGLILGLFIMNLPMSNMALIGMISLLGLVVNDSIVMLEFLYQNIDLNKEFIPELVDKVSTRFRPIFMTTITTLVGVAPLAFGFAGNEFLLQPLAVVIFFGMLSVTLITLILLPLIISILQLDQRKNKIFTEKSTRGISKTLQPLIKQNKLNLLLLLPLCFISPIFSQTTNTNLVFEDKVIYNEDMFLSIYLENSFKEKIIKENLKISDQKVNIAFEPYTGSFFANLDIGYANTTNPIPLQNIAINGEALSKDLRADGTNYTFSIGADALIYPLGTYLKVQGGIKNTDFRSQMLDISPTQIPPQLQEFREKSLLPYFNITLVQPLLQNGFAYNIHSKVIKIARNRKSIEYLQEKLKLQDIIFKALIKYHKLILDTKILSIREKTLQEITSVYNYQRRLANVGARSLFDIQQLEVKIKQIALDINDAMSQLELDIQNLEEELGVSLDRNELNFFEYSLLSEKIFSEQDTYRIALENSMDLVQLSLHLQNAKYALDITKNKYLPELNAIVSYETSESFFKNHPTLNINGSQFTIPQDQFYFGLQLKTPISLITKNAKIKEAYAQITNLKYTEEDTKLEIKLATREKVRYWQQIKNRILQQEDIISVERSIAKEASTRYQNSEISLIDFFEYQENLRQSEIKLAVDQFNQILSSFTIEAIQGTLLSTYNIELI